MQKYNDLISDSTLSLIEAVKKCDFDRINLIQETQEKDIDFFNLILIEQAIESGNQDFIKDIFNKYAHLTTPECIRDIILHTVKMNSLDFIDTMLSVKSVAYSIDHAIISELIHLDSYEAYKKILPILAENNFFFNPYIILTNAVSFGRKNYITFLINSLSKEENRTIDKEYLDLLSLSISSKNTECFDFLIDYYTSIITIGDIINIFQQSCLSLEITFVKKIHLLFTSHSNQTEENYTKLFSYNFIKSFVNSKPTTDQINKRNNILLFISNIPCFSRLISQDWIEQNVIDLSSKNTLILNTKLSNF